MPIPYRWKLDGDELVLQEIRSVRVDIEDMLSMESMPYGFLEAMSEFDKIEAETDG